MPWTLVAPGVESSDIDDISACEKLAHRWVTSARVRSTSPLAFRQHPTDRKMTEARGLFSIIQARMVTVIAVKETLAFTSNYETCKTGKFAPWF